MNRFVQRFISTSLLSLLIIGLTAFIPPVALAGSLTEIESNNSSDTATGIDVNTQVSGSISDSSDVDWYQFTLTTAGKASITFKHDAVGSANWEIDLYRYNPSTGELTLLTEFDSSGSNLSLTSSSVGLPAGAYCIKIDRGWDYSSVSYSVTASFSASAVWEKEFNDSLQTASAIQLNTAYSGSMMTSSDKDWFRFTLPSSGRSSITFKHAAMDSANWEIDVYRYNPNTGEQTLLTEFDSSGSNLNLTSSSLGLPAGTYFIKIDRGWDYSNVPYSVTASFIASTIWEKEFNDSLQTASTIALNAAHYGSMMTSSDKDWYRFTLPSSGRVNITLKHDAVESANWEIGLYRYNSNTGEQTLLTEFDSKGSNLSLTSSSVGLPTGTYYIRIDRGWDYSNIPYSITASFIASSVWEKEFNDSLQTASTIQLNTAFWGSLMTSSDEDWYRVTLPTTQVVQLDFVHASNNSSSTYWEAKLYKYNPVTGDKTILSEFDSRGNSVNTKSAGIRLPAGTYYVSVDESYYYSATPYSLTVSWLFDKPSSIKAASASYNSIKMTWSAVSGAVGYDVYRSTTAKGSYSKVGTSNTTSYVNASLTTGTTYYYKVRAYRMNGKTKIYSSYSSPIAAKPTLSAPGSFTATRASSSSIKLAWAAVSGASGYEVYRYNSSTGAYQRIAKFSYSVKSYINTGLTKNKVYYYKVRAYRTVGANTVHGPFSPVKGAKLY